ADLSKAAAGRGARIGNSPQRAAGTRVAAPARMECLLHRHFWIPTLLLVAAAAFCTARLAGTLLEGAPRLPGLRPLDAEPSPPLGAGRPAKDAAVVLAGHLFRAAPRTPGPAEPRSSVEDAHVGETDLGAELIGVVDADPRALSF